MGGLTIDSWSLCKSTVTCCDSTSEQTSLLERGFLSDGHNRVFGDDGVLGEGRTAHLDGQPSLTGLKEEQAYEVLDVLAFALESRSSVRHDTLTLGGPDYPISFVLITMAIEREGGQGR